jgi:hypothetical protein
MHPLLQSAGGQAMTAQQISLSWSQPVLLLLLLWRLWLSQLLLLLPAPHLLPSQKAVAPLIHLHGPLAEECSENALVGAGI